MPLPSPRIYIAGPMTGYPSFNFPAFREKEAALRLLNYTPISPHAIAEDLGLSPLLPYSTYLRASLSALLTCSSIALLPGWEASPGASLEHAIAKALSLPIFYPSSPIPPLPASAAPLDNLPAYPHSTPTL